MAVNYSSVAEKVFKVLKGSGLNIQMFNAQDGKELSNPEQSRFFYVADPNLMINLDDKNQELKVHKGPENIAVLSDLLKSLKNLAKDNLLDFDLREFGREIKPKNYTYRLNTNKVIEEIDTMDTNMEKDQDKMNTTANLRDVVSQKLTAPVMMHQRNASQSEFDPAKVTQFRDKDAKIAFRLSDLAARAHDDEISVYLARMSDKFSGNDPEGWSSRDERNADIRVINSILKKIQEPKPVAKAEATNSELPEFNQLEEALNRLTGTDVVVDVVVESSHDSMVKDREDYMAKRKALQDIQMRPMDDKLKAEVMRRKAELEDAAKKMGLKESITEGGNAWDLADTESKETIENAGSEQEALQGLQDMIYPNPKDADENWANDIINDYIEMIKTQGFDKVQAGIERANFEPEIPEMPESKEIDSEVKEDRELDSADKMVLAKLMKELDGYKSMVAGETDRDDKKMYKERLRDLESMIKNVTRGRPIDTALEDELSNMYDAVKGVKEDAELTILKRNAGMKETKGKDHDGDGAVDSDDYMAAKDKAIKKAMSEDKNEVIARMQDLINYRR